MTLRALRRLPLLPMALSTLTLAACTTNPGPRSELVYGLTLVPSGIDPHINASSELGIPLSSVYDTLIAQGPETGEFVPGLATDWDISPDGLTYTFSLRQDVKFHDGSPFNAEAVRANIEYILDPEHRSQKAIFMLGTLERVQVLAEFRVALQLREPFAPLLDSLAQVYLGMASPTALSQWGPSEYPFHQVGTGPYRFLEYIPNDHMTLEKNDEYSWAPSVYENREASIDRIVFQFYEDAATRGLALESRAVDIMGEIPPNEALRLSTLKEFDLYPIPIPGQPLQLLFNIRRPPTDDILVRQALVLAVDREAIVSTLFGGLSPVAKGPLASATLGFAPDYAFPGYDPAQAGALLDQAGWKESDGDWRAKDGARLKLGMVVPTWGFNPEAAQLVKVAWENLGAEVDLKVAPGFGPLKEAQSEGEYNAIGINFFGRDPDLLRPFFTIGGLYNWMGVEDPEIDRLLNAAAKTQDLQTRIGMYAQLAEKVRDDALILPIRDYTNLVVASSRFSGLHFSSQGWFPFLIDLHLQP